MRSTSGRSVSRRPLGDPAEDAAVEKLPRALRLVILAGLMAAAWGLVVALCAGIALLIELLGVASPW
jgi:hypothetical protein